jgi:hypothetical protein
LWRQWKQRGRVLTLRSTPLHRHVNGNRIPLTYREFFYEFFTSVSLVWACYLLLLVVLHPPQFYPCCTITTQQCPPTPFPSMSVSYTWDPPPSMLFPQSSPSFPNLSAISSQPLTAAVLSFHSSSRSRPPSPADCGPASTAAVEPARTPVAALLVCVPARTHEPARRRRGRPGTRQRSSGRRAGRYTRWPLRQARLRQVAHLGLAGHPCSRSLLYA